jgi:hypothetical protein
MARNYAPIRTSIWDDDDFRALSADAQLVYLMMISQSMITSVGLVPMALRRWANSTKGMTPKALSKALQELSDALYVVIDWDREELLVRSFVRWDGGYTNALRLKAIQREACAVASKPLAAVLAYELDRLDVQHGITIDPYDVRSKGLRRVFDGGPKGQGCGYVSTEEDGTPSQNHDREPLPGARTPRRGSAAHAQTRIAEDFALDDSMRSWSAENTPSINIDRETANFIDYWRSTSRNPTKTDWLATWRKWMRGEQTKAEQFRGQSNGRPVNGSRPSTTDQRVSDALAMAARYAEQESREEQQRLEIEA